MSTILHIAYALGIGALAVLVMSIFVSPRQIHELLARFFFILMNPADRLQNGCRKVIQRAWVLMKQAGTSVGISGEHWIQRVVGTLLLTIPSVLGLFVGFLNLMVVIGGVFGSMANSVMRSLPVPLETLTAIELIVAAFVFGLLLLDTIGWTHLTKFFSAEHMGRWGRVVMATIFAAGIVASIYITAQSGTVRFESLMPDAQTAAHVEAQAAAVPSSLSMAGSISGNAYDYEEARGAEMSAPVISDGYKRAVRHIMVGIPIVSIVSGIFAGTAFIPFAAMAILFPLFLGLAALFGLGWILGRFFALMVDLIYNFAIAFVNIFMGLGQSIRRRFTGESAPVESAEEGAPVIEDNAAVPQAEQKGAATDPWNPLGL